MRTRFIVATSLAALLLATGASATYQHREFDPSAITTMTVEVVAVEELASARGSGLHLRARAGDEEVYIRLGPAAEIMTLGFAARPGDVLVVTGSRLEEHEMIVLVASEIERDGQSWRLRSPEGVPVWAGRGQGAPADDAAARALGGDGERARDGSGARGPQRGAGDLAGTGSPWHSRVPWPATRSSSRTTPSCTPTTPASCARDDSSN